MLISKNTECYGIIPIVLGIYRISRNPAFVGFDLMYIDPNACDETYVAAGVCGEHAMDERGVA